MYIWQADFEECLLEKMNVAETLLLADSYIMCIFAIVFCKY
jgi:hypothetical protein